MGARSAGGLPVEYETVDEEKMTKNINKKFYSKINQISDKQMSGKINNKNQKLSKYTKARQGK